jgi:hypothetical protein
MKKAIFVAALAMLATACTSVSTTKVGGKEVIHVNEVKLKILNNGASINECIASVGEKGATRLVDAGGPVTGGLLGLTRMISPLIGIEMCSAVGVKE